MEKEICILKNFRNILDATTDTDCSELDKAIATIEEALKPKTCQECKWWDRTRPRSHPNYAECSNRDCPLSYVEVIHTFGCNMYEPKDNA